ncbi:hypothetical protein D9757_008957 [Collybiopsis confluens]|uniref:Endonuclease III homolog n=1 Tax=Collybiopsis confluens TaxID=2823264 RepID=A0A8H5HFY3_9AGAR|nr:hypothetical protein D9757_008957 [Collybiopsis confluens]
MTSRLKLPSTRALRSSTTRPSTSQFESNLDVKALKAQRSSLNASVTLFELDEPRFDSRPAKRVKLDSDSKEGVLDCEDSVAKKHKSTKSRLPRKAKVSSSPQPAPVKWRQAYDLIAEMRYASDGCARDAPVDTMGCDIAGEGEGLEGEDKNKRFSILISLMLSSQTKDQVTHAAITNLRSSLGGSLSASSLASAPLSQIEESINKVGFWRRKSEYVQAAAVRCRDSYGGDVPKTIEELLEFKAVGNKMGYLMLQSGWGLNSGIGVDVHVHRITNRLGWHKPPTKVPEETRVNLESWLPHELHPKINHMLVGFGQMICTPIRPNCSECSLSSVEGLCPSVKLTSSSPRKGKQVSGKAKGDVLTGDLMAGELEMKEGNETMLEAGGGGPSIKIELENIFSGSRL